MKTKLILKHIGVIAIVLASVTVLGCVESQPSAPSRSIIIYYSVQKTDSFFREAPTGKVFLLIGVTIENRGYKSFRVGPAYFSVIANNVKYDASQESYTMGQRLYTSDVLDGGAAIGSILFEVPSNIESFQLQYNSNEHYNIDFHQII